jgi:Autographiviridae endonuclease VII
MFIRIVMSIGTGVARSMYTANSSYYEKNKEKIKARATAWQRTHPEKARARMKLWRQANPEKIKAQALAWKLSRYGISPEQYDDMWVEQIGLCAICHEPEKGRKSLHVDHDHASGEVRGLLCHCCNIMIGMARDNKMILESGVSYLTSGEQEVGSA